MRIPSGYYGPIGGIWLQDGEKVVFGLLCMACTDTRSVAPMDGRMDTR